MWVGQVSPLKWVKCPSLLTPLYTGGDLASILHRHKKTLQSETLADTLSIVVDQPVASLPSEVYREKISPRELKKLENYTVEVVLGRV